MLTTLTLFPIVAALLLVLTPNDKEKLIYSLNIALSLVPLVMLLMAGPLFSPPEQVLSLLESKEWIPQIGASYCLGLDGINLPFLGMLTFLAVIASLVPPLPGENLKKRSILLLLWEATLIGAFLAQDYVLFLVFWAAGTAPLYFLLKPSLESPPMPAARCYVLSTLLSIVALGSGLLILTTSLNTTAFASDEVADAILTNLDPNTQWWVFLAVFLGCTLRIPIFPFHIWLRLTIGQLPLSAAILLVGGFIPLGVYTLMRFALLVLPDALIAFTLVLAASGAINLVFGSLAALGTTNRHHKTAYYIMGYTGMALLGMATLTTSGISGAFYTILALGTAITFSLMLSALSSVQGTPHGWPLVVHGLETAQQLRLPGFPGFIGLFLIFPTAFRHFSSLAFAIVGALFLLAIDYAQLLTEILEERQNQTPVEFESESSNTPDRQLLPIPGGAMAAVILLLGASMLLGLKPELVLGVIEPAINQIMPLLN